MRFITAFFLILSFFTGTSRAQVMNSPAADTGKSLLVRRFLLHDERILLAPHRYRGGLSEERMANLFFDRDASKINLDLPANRIPFVRHQLELLFEPLGKGWQPDTVWITAYASPEGDSLHNAALAQKRAASGSGYVSSRISIHGIHPSDCTILMETAGEDWEGLVKTLQASDLTGRDEIIHIIENQYTTDEDILVQLQKSTLYPTIKQNFYPLLRRISIRISYHEPPITDEEMLQCALEEPASLYYEQLMYAATLTGETEKKLAIYRNASGRYPEEWEAPNNIACLYLEMDQPEKAMVYLNQANTLFPVCGTILNNMAAASLKMYRPDKALQYLDLAGKEETDVSYNLGICFLLAKEYARAFSLLETHPCTTNAALAALMANQTARAVDHLRCTPETSTRHYLLAICAARNQDEAGVMSELNKAIRLNSSLLDYLRNDIEFLPYKEKDWFAGLLSR